MHAGPLYMTANDDVNTMVRGDRQERTTAPGPISSGPASEDDKPAILPSAVTSEPLYTSALQQPLVQKIQYAFSAPSQIAPVKAPTEVMLPTLLSEAWSEAWSTLTLLTLSSCLKSWNFPMYITARLRNPPRIPRHLLSSTHGHFLQQRMSLCLGWHATAKYTHVLFSPESSRRAGSDRCICPFGWSDIRYGSCVVYCGSGSFVLTALHALLASLRRNSRDMTCPPDWPPGTAGHLRNLAK